VKVKAIKQGYYGVLREPGEEFEIESPTDKGSWMESIEEEPKRRGRAVKDAPEE
jgi:hypothetical protein